MVKTPPGNAGAAGDTSSILGSGRSLEEAMATCSRILAWKIPWIEEPGRLQFMRSQKVRQLNNFTSTYLRLLMFLPPIPVCNSSSPAFLMMCSAYRLNNQGDSRQPYRTPFSNLNQSVVPYSVLTVASNCCLEFTFCQFRCRGKKWENGVEVTGHRVIQEEVKNGDQSWIEKKTVVSKKM